MNPDQISQLNLAKDQILTFLNWLEDNESSEDLRSAEFKKLAWDLHVRSLDWVNGSDVQSLQFANEAIEESMQKRL